jgi:Tetratricopeptide repeat
VADDDGRAGRSAAWGVVAAVFSAAAGVTGPEAAAPGSGFLLVPTCAFGVIAVAGLYMCFATLLGWPAGHFPAGAAARKDGKSTDDARAPVALGRAPRPAFLEGRDELLAELDARFACPPRPVVVLCGLGGVGKTSAAVEYAYRRSAEFGVVCQFIADDRAAVEKRFGELAVELGVRDLRDAGDPVGLVHEMLARRGDWLLIFDNAPDPAAVRGLLPAAGNGRVLVTSQNSDWPGGQVLEVPMLERATAAAFLLTRADAPSTQQAAAEELADKLGRLPLALEQAGAYMRSSGLSIPKYLSLFRQRSEDLLGRRGQNPDGYENLVTTTWDLAFTHMDQAVPAAAGLLRFAAYCAPEDIPLNQLMQPRRALAGMFPAQVASQLMPLLEDELVRADAVQALRRYSLISRPDRGLISVHRLVQEITRTRLPAELAAGWQRAAEAVIDAALPDTPDNPADWDAFAALLPHARAALDPASDGMSKIAIYLHASGNFSAALTVQRQILDARIKDPGAQHPATLTARARCATFTGEAGDAAAARDQYTELLPVMTDVLGAEDPDTLAARASLAYWTGGAGNAAAARDQYTELLPVITHVQGEEHPDTLAVRSNLARFIGDLGDAVKARNQYADLLRVQERDLGTEHPLTLTTRASLAYWTGEARDPVTAREQYADVVTVRRRVLGEKHPRTLTARAAQARWTGKAGDAAAARDQYQELLQDRERWLGKEHPDTLATRDDLAYWTRQAER